EPPLIERTTVLSGEGTLMPRAQLSPVVRHIRKLVEAQTTKELTDAQLLHRFAIERDHTAFAALLQRHGRLVLGVCRQGLGNLQDAEDAFQATFLVLAREAASIRQGDVVGSWLYRVAYRIATKAGMAMSRRRALEQQARKTQPREPACELAWRELQTVLQE